MPAAKEFLAKNPDYFFAEFKIIDADFLHQAGHFSKVLIDLIIYILKYVFFKLKVFIMKCLI